MYYQIEMEVNARFGHCADTSFAFPFTDTERPRPYDLVCRIRFGGGNIIPSDMSHRPTMLVPVSPDSRGLTHFFGFCLAGDRGRSEEHTSELKSLMRTSYAVFCLKKKNLN